MSERRKVVALPGTRHDEDLEPGSKFWFGWGEALTDAWFFPAPSLRAFLILEMVASQTDFSTPGADRWITGTVWGGI